jgi:hypothetical protein
MRTASSHITRYPHCRSSTLAHLIAQDKLHEQMRRENAARRRRDLFARFLRIIGMGRKAGA